MSRLEVNTHVIQLSDEAVLMVWNMRISLFMVYVWLLYENPEQPNGRPHIRCAKVLPLIPTLGKPHSRGLYLNFITKHPRVMAHTVMIGSCTYVGGELLFVHPPRLSSSHK